MTEKDFLYLLNQEQREAYFKYKSEHLYKFTATYSLVKQFALEYPETKDYCLEEMAYAIIKEILERKKYKLTRNDGEYQINYELEIDTIL